MSGKSAIVTGLRGMDGSIAAEKLLALDYKVYGVIRRSSQGLDLGQAAKLEGNQFLEVIEGDITDSTSMNSLCRLAKADIFVHLAAQSHVGSSFNIPSSTFKANAIGTLNCLEAVRQSGIHTRFLHASTSELFGGLTSEPCNENTPFHPRSPYGVAKLAAHWAVVNYRESYKLFACNSICFNHECFFADTPVILKRDEEISIEYVQNLIPNRKNITKDETQLIKDYEGYGYEIWDGSSFVELKTVSRRKLSTLSTDNQKRQITVCPRGAVSTTPNHSLISSDGEKLPASTFTRGSTVKLGSFPENAPNKVTTLEFAELLGLLCGDGYISDANVSLTNNDSDIRNRCLKLFNSCYCGIQGKVSTFTSDYKGQTTHLDISGLSKPDRQALRTMLYDRKTKHKKVPHVIINAAKNIQLAFLKGYNAADGLKAGNETYEFASFKSNSPLLLQGLMYLIQATTGQKYNINPFEQRGKIYTQVNLNTPCPSGTEKHLRVNPATIKKTLLIAEDNQHVYDIETSSGVLMAGIGAMIVGNSPARGPNFVTRKITIAAAKISKGLQDKLYLGNLEAKRDWSWAPDMVDGMILMLTKSPQPKDYVMASGKTHSVREFCNAAFQAVNLDYQAFVEVDPRFYRPCEVDVLLGDSSAIQKDLGWKHTKSFQELVETMVHHDLQLLEK